MSKSIPRPAPFTAFPGQPAVIVPPPLPPTIVVPTLLDGRSRHSVVAPSPALRADRSILIIAPSGAGKTVYLTMACFASRPSHGSSREASMRITPDLKTMDALRGVTDKLLAQGEFPDATQLPKDLCFCFFAKDPLTGNNVDYLVDAVDSTGGAFNNLQDAENEEANQLRERLLHAHGLILLIDIANLGEGPLALEYVIERNFRLLESCLMQEARSAGKRPAAQINKNIAVVLSQVDQLISEDREGTLRFRKRPVLSRTADGCAEVDLVDMPSDVMLDLAPQNVRTYLCERCGAPGKRIVETLERSFCKVGFFAMSAVGMVRNGAESIPNVRMKDGRVMVRDPRALVPIGVLEPIAWAIDPSAFEVEEPAPVPPPAQEPTLVVVPQPPPPVWQPPPVSPLAPRPFSVPSMHPRAVPAWAPFIALGMFTVTFAAVMLMSFLRGTR